LSVQLVAQIDERICLVAEIRANRGSAGGRKVCAIQAAGSELRADPGNFGYQCWDISQCVIDLTPQIGQSRERARESSDDMARVPGTGVNFRKVDRAECFWHLSITS